MTPAPGIAQAHNFAPFWWLAALMAAASLLIAQTPAHAQQSSDPIIAQARAAGQVGEQADGYLGVVAGQNPSAEVRAHVEQLNMRRRTSFTSAANARGVGVSDFAAAVACQFFTRIGPGEHYRDQSNQWRQRTASEPVQMPSFCGNG